MTQKTVAIEPTKWFNAVKQVPGQPGVFEVDAIVTSDLGHFTERFAFFDGVKFGASMPTPAGAYDARFLPAVLPVSRFRGLSEEA